MNITNKILLVAFILAVAVPLAFAGHHYHGYGHGKDMSWNMSDKDSNGDGTLSFEEFSAKQMDMLRAGFDMIDTDKDGKISVDEWNTFLKVHGVSPKA
ncbi:MAG: hypothetical protein QNJ48_07820 [Desulfobacterales bacterium]|nr:hypothetical protein [Desulfobacterales bacterium]MDJ0876435.1 hypothetical protein [Desulfobacterales bacterium]MDJ0884053.1 hypothetical protein [Desulfobacterales bacterium]